ATTPSTTPSSSSCARSCRSADAQLGVVDALRGQLDVDGLGHVGEDLGGLAVRLDGHDGRPGVAPRPQFGYERHLTEQRHLEALGQVGPTAGAEQLVALAVV